MASSRSSRRGGAGVVGLAGHVDPPAAVRPDVAADGDRTDVAERRPRRAPCPARRAARRSAPIRRRVSSSRPRVAGSRPARCIASAIETPSVSVSAAGPVGAERAGDDAGARAGDAEPGALLVDEVDDPQRHGRARSRRARSWSTAARAPTTPSGPSKAPPSGTESRCEPMTTPGSPAATALRVAPPGPLVAHPVLDEVEPAVGALAGEPLAQVVVLAGPREAVVAAAVAVAAEGLEVGPHPAEARGGPADAVLVDMAPFDRAGACGLGSHVPGDCLGAQTLDTGPTLGR